MKIKSVAKTEVEVAKTRSLSVVLKVDLDLIRELKEFEDVEGELPDITDFEFDEEEQTIRFGLYMEDVYRL